MAHEFCKDADGAPSPLNVSPRLVSAVQELRSRCGKLVRVEAVTADGTGVTVKSAASKFVNHAAELEGVSVVDQGNGKLALSLSESF